MKTGPTKKPVHTGEVLTAATAGLILSLALAGPWEPASRPPPTVWAQAGARTFATCGRLDRAARASLGTRTLEAGDSATVWLERARRCPHAPSVLVVSARTTIVRRELPAPESSDDATIDARATARRKDLERALAWLDAAAAESARRQQPPPTTTHYFRAYAYLALGRPQPSQTALQQAVAAGEVERWRADRTRALAHLLAGDLDQALGYAHRAILDSTGSAAEEGTVCRQVYALVLDRAGASAEARRIFGGLHERRQVTPGSGAQNMLPVHEQLYLRALTQQARGNVASALALWNRYLARSEPEDPERKLAERHRRQLVPAPESVDGPGG